MQNMGKKSKLYDRFFNSASAVATGSIAALGAASGVPIEATVAGLMSFTSVKQQSRLERNMKQLEKELFPILDSIEKDLATNTKKLNDFERALELFMRYIIDEPQSEKIKTMVNGLKNLAYKDEIKEDFVLLYYDTLRDLRVLDITVLNSYYQKYFMSNEELEEQGFVHLTSAELEITDEELRAINEKLIRMGLLQTSQLREIGRMRENIDILIALHKGKKGKLFKRTSNFNRVIVTNFGMQFMDFFLNKDKVGAGNGSI